MTDGSLSIRMVSTFYPPYHFGGEAYLYRVSNALTERGHRVTVVQERET